LKIAIPREVEDLIKILEHSGYEGYIVGGCVRDSLIGKSPNDWDLTTNAKPEDITKIFSNYQILTSGIKHGTITVVIKDKNYEITTFRIDGDYVNNRHPEKVEYTNSIQMDLSRRDFTINAMAYSDKSGLVDPFNGYNDLVRGLIRCVGEPNKRFKEDALRMLRGIRFCTQLGFNIEGNTLRGIVDNSHLLNNISKERIRDELNKILLSPRPSIGIRLLVKTKLIDIILPEVRSLVGFNQHNPYHDKDVFEHTLAVLDNTDSDLILRLSALFHDIAKPQCFSIDEKGIGHFYNHHNFGVEITKNILLRLKYDNYTIEQVTRLIKEHMIKFHNLSIKSVKKLINRIGNHNMNRLIDLIIADIKGSKPPYDFSNIDEIKDQWEMVINENHPLTVKSLDINGNDLKKLGLEEGRGIGILLNKLLEVVLENPELNKKEYLIAEAIKIIKTHKY